MPQLPRARVEREVVGDCVDVIEHPERLPGERRAANRRAESTALDQVPLGDAEDKLTACRIDHPATEALDEQPTRRVAEQIGRVVVTGSDVEVRHSRNRQVLVGLAPAVTGVR